MSHFGYLLLVLTLSYTITPSGNDQDYQITDGLIEFQCTYNRQIDIDEFEINFDSEISSPIRKHGSLGFSLEVNVANVGEMSKMIIKPEHNVDGVIAT